jgi:hypothetical protein
VDEIETRTRVRLDVVESEKRWDLDLSSHLVRSLCEVPVAEFLNQFSEFFSVSLVPAARGPEYQELQNSGITVGQTPFVKPRPRASPAPDCVQQKGSQQVRKKTRLFGSKGGVFPWKVFLWQNNVKQTQVALEFIQKIFVPISKMPQRPKSIFVAPVEVVHHLEQH